MSDLKDLTDERLVEKICNQNQEWYAEIIERYQSKIERYVGIIVRDEGMMADAVQETFIKGFVNLRSFDTKQKFSSWLYRLAHNEAINQIRKNKNKIHLPEDSEIEDERPEANIEELFSKKETQELVTKLLSQMPQMYTEPLVLSYLDDRSYSEISDILRLPINTVGVRISRAKKIMRQLWLNTNQNQ